MIKIDVDTNDKILILGCGLSDTRWSSQIILNNIICYLRDYNNLDISDYSDISEEIFNIHENKIENGVLKKTSPIYYKENKIGKTPMLIKKMLNERFIKIDLLNEDLSKIGKYDYIDLTNIIHLKNFNCENRFEILKKLYNRLNDGGSIGIKFYTKLDKNKQFKKFYNLITEKEISGWEKEFKTEKCVDIDKEGNNFCEIVIKKNNKI